MDTILIIDFGSQVTQLIARRLRAMRYHAEIVPYSVDISQVAKAEIKGIILSGGPSSVYAKNSPHADRKIFAINKPILGICYGLQEITHQLGGIVVRGTKREYGRSKIKKTFFGRGPAGRKILSGIPTDSIVWMSHGDAIKKIPNRFRSIAASANSPFAAIADIKRHFYGVQFHLEVAHTKYGEKILENFAKICKMRKQWTALETLDQTIVNISTAVGDATIIHALSGGVDSTVLALLLNKALRKSRVKNIFINNGLLRLNEAKQVLSTFKKLGLNVIFIDASKKFLIALKGISDP